MLALRVNFGLGVGVQLGTGQGLLHLQASVEALTIRHYQAIVSCYKEEATAPTPQYSEIRLAAPTDVREPNMYDGRPSKPSMQACIHLSRLHDLIPEG